MSLGLSLAIVGGGVFAFKKLVLDTTANDAPKTRQPLPIVDTNGDPIVGAVSYPIPDFIGFTTTFVSTEVTIDSTVNGQPLAGVMGSGPAGAWYAQFQQGPPELAGRDLMNAGSGQPFCSRPTGAAEFNCDPAVQVPIFLKPYTPMSSVSALVLFVPANVRPYAIATFVGPEDLNGVTRTRYDIQIDGLRFQQMDPSAYSEWANAMLIDVSGTVRLQLWIDENQMVWKSDVRVDGMSDHQSLTVTRANQLPLIIPFVAG